MKKVSTGSLSKQIATIKDAINFITENGQSLGLTADEMTSAIANLQNMLNDIDKVLADEATAEQSATAQRHNSIAGNLQLGLVVNRMKSSANWKPDYDKKFRTDRKKFVVDTVLYKPKFTLKIVANNLEVHFIKRGVDGVNITVKAADETVFTFDQLALKSPVILKRQFKAGVTQLVSVQLQAFKGGKPIGQPSDIATIAFTA